MKIRGFLNTKPVHIPSPMETQDPFLFAVYHYDKYPVGDHLMQAPGRGNGSDFDSSKPYRYYHGDRIPGFPQHPHRGFETISCIVEGLVDHADSLGAGGRYGNGDVQYMTAGKGIVHNEMFPLVHDDKPNTLKMFQLWLNLPRKKKFVEPGQKMLWAEEIPIIKKDKVSVRVWAGELEGVKALPAAKNSYAFDPEHNVGIFLIEMKPNSTFTLPPTTEGTNRSIYYVTGKGLVANDVELEFPSQSNVDPLADIKFENKGTELVQVLVLQGKPIGEKVVQHGPFVMNTQQEIYEAFDDYQKTKFGGWPWEQHAVVFPREKGRFLKLNDGKEITPPTPK